MLFRTLLSSVSFLAVSANTMADIKNNSILIPNNGTGGSGSVGALVTGTVDTLTATCASGTQVVGITALEGTCKWATGVVTCWVQVLDANNHIGAYFTAQGACTTSAFAFASLTANWFGSTAIATNDILNINIICNESNPSGGEATALEMSTVAAESATCS